MSRRITAFEKIGAPSEIDEFFRGACRGNSPQFERLKRSLHSVVERELSEQQRHCVQLCYFEGLSVTDAAEQMQLNKSTVSRHLARAREKIAYCLRYSIY